MAKKKEPTKKIKTNPEKATNLRREASDERQVAKSMRNKVNSGELITQKVYFDKTVTGHDVKKGAKNKVTGVIGKKSTEKVARDAEKRAKSLDARAVTQDPSLANKVYKTKKKK